jgi:hypothetical protein
MSIDRQIKETNKNIYGISLGSYGYKLYKRNKQSVEIEYLGIYENLTGVNKRIEMEEGFEGESIDEERFHREKQEDDEAYMERLYREGRD